MENQNTQQGKQINPAYVAQEAQGRVYALTEENMMLGAYVKQLEARVQQLEAELAQYRNKDNDEKEERDV